MRVPAELPCRSRLCSRCVSRDRDRDRDTARPGLSPISAGHTRTRGCGGLVDRSGPWCLVPRGLVSCCLGCCLGWQRARHFTPAVTAHAGKRAERRGSRLRQLVARDGAPIGCASGAQRAADGRGHRPMAAALDEQPNPLRVLRAHRGPEVEGTHQVTRDHARQVVGCTVETANRRRVHRLSRWHPADLPYPLRKGGNRAGEHGRMKRVPRRDANTADSEDADDPLEAFDRRYRPRDNDLIGSVVPGHHQVGVIDGADQ